MRNDSPIIVVYPIDSEIRIVQIAPGADPSTQPLLSHAGLVCDLGDKVYVAPDGVKGSSPHTRQFLTMVNNDLTEPMLTYLAEEFNCPAALERLEGFYRHGKIAWRPRRGSRQAGFVVTEPIRFNKISSAARMLYVGEKVTENWELITPQ